MNKSLIIHWVRHAESCANLDQGTVNDNIPNNYNESCGYQQKEKIQYQAKKQERSLSISAFKAPFIYEPNLSFIGMQHAINLGIEFIKNEMNKKKYDIVLASPMTRTVMTALLAFRHYPNVKIYVVPFISEHENIMAKVDHDYQNSPVKSYELKKKVKFVKDWLEEKWLKNYDDIEIIKILNHLKKKIENDKNKDYIYNEIINALQHKPNIIKCEKGNIESHEGKLPQYDISKLIKLLNNNINNFESEEQKMINEMHELIDPKIIRGPEVDFSVLEKFELKYEEKERGSNFNKFYEEVLPEFLNVIKGDKILCVSHGSAMKEYFNNKYSANIGDIANTEVFEETLEISNDKGLKIYNKNVKEIYKPISIRNSYQNFEYLNYDICRTESLKGILNYYMTEKFEAKYKDYSGKVPQDDRELVPVLSKYFSNKPSKDYVNPDIKFYYEKKWSDYMPKDKIIKGGYYDKYIKYKQKYLELKNKISNM